MTELETCYHCGGPGQIKNIPKPFPHGWVGCPTCGIYKQWIHDPADAIRTWNRRIQKPSAVRPVESMADRQQTRNTVTLPCGVGDRIWRLEKKGNAAVLAAHTVEKIEIVPRGFYLCFGWKNMGYEIVRADAIGKTVFLSAEEGQRALRMRATT